MMLLVEQNARIALELATRGYVLETGAIVAEGPAAGAAHGCTTHGSVPRLNPGR